MTATPSADDDDLGPAAVRHGAKIHSFVSDGSGWRWRVGWKGVEIGAWNDMDGVAIVADIGPWDEWLGLQGHPPDPSPAEALGWVVATLDPWLAVPDNAERIAERVMNRALG